LVQKFVAHSRRVLKIAERFGWLPGARYTNLRDVRKYDRLGFLDIEWKNYSFHRHLEAAKATNPLVTVALDIENPRKLPEIIDQAHELNLYSDRVVIVPKHLSLQRKLHSHIPKQFVLGYSVPTRYGGTLIPARCFTRPVHLLRLIQLVSLTVSDTQRTKHRSPHPRAKLRKFQILFYRDFSNVLEIVQ
jgi:hypothetical protein